MTDEQYIDALFAKEPCGYQDTPGFASMHLAYRAGMDSAPTWTTDRPTEPGEYWVSMPPSRQRTPRVESVSVQQSPFDSQLMVEMKQTTWRHPVGHSYFDGAKWSRRETPCKMSTTWTDNRPTEPGEYWVSLSPDRRALAAKYPAGLERPVERVWIEVERLKTRLGWSMSLTAGWLDGVELLDGAKWSRRETPADPFQ